MGCEDTVGRGEQGAVRGDRLLGNHVHGGAPEFSGMKRTGYRVFGNQRASGGVEEDCSILHPGNGLRIDDFSGFREQRTVKGNDITALQKLIQLNIAADGLPFDALAAAIGKDVHPEGPGNTAYRSADFAEADDAYGFSCQLHLRCVPEAEVRAFAPAALVYQGVVESDSVAQLQKQGEGVLGNRICAIGWNVAHRDTPCFRGGCVDHIIPRCLYADQSDTGAGIQEGGGDGCFVGQKNIGPLASGDGLGLCGGAVIERDLSEWIKTLPVQVTW